MPMSSLKARITLLTSSLVGLLWLLAVGGTWIDAQHEAEELFDAHLVQAASLLIAQAGSAMDHHAEEEAFEESHAPELHRYGRRVAFQVWIGDRLRLHSSNAPAQPLSPQSEGLSEVLIGGERWRVFSAWNEAHQVQVQVGERMAAREELARAVATGLLRPLLVALPLLALLIWIAVRYGMVPLERLAIQVEQRAPDKLTFLPVENLPGEVVPLVERLNILFQRLGQSFEQERRFTADAAHELRTPLAGLRAQAEVALDANDDAARRHALVRLIEGCDRLTHLVEQLLALARVDAARPEEFVRLDLAALVRDILAEMVSAALSKGVGIELEADQPVPILGNPAWLTILVRNLVDNAVRYSPQGSVVQLAIFQDAAGPILKVEDQGPGVPEEALTCLGQRFRRNLALVSDDGSGEGSGLGLSIVRRVAALHGGAVDFRNRNPPCDHGLTVSVRLPPSIDTVPS